MGVSEPGELRSALFEEHGDEWFDQQRGYGKRYTLPDPEQARADRERLEEERTAEEERLVQLEQRRFTAEALKAEAAERETRERQASDQRRQFPLAQGREEERQPESSSSSRREPRKPSGRKRWHERESWFKR